MGRDKLTYMKPETSQPIEFRSWETGYSRYDPGIDNNSLNRGCCEGIQMKLKPIICYVLLW